MIRTLQFKYSLKLDGVTAIMLNLYEHMDPEEVSWDFLVGDAEVPEDIRRRIEERGGRIYSIAAACPEKNPLAYTFHKILFSMKLMKENQYDLVHVHTESAGRSLILVLAALAGVKGRILHAHSSFIRSGKGVAKHKLCRRLLPLWANGFLTCSGEAAKWMFPSGMIKKKRVVTIPNGICLDRYRFSEEIRAEARKEFVAEGEKVFLLCTVGRLSPEKNYPFLLLVVKELKERMKTAEGQGGLQFRLLFAGEGPEEERIRKWAKELQVEELVSVLGNRQDVPGILQAADCFLLSSLFEGLPLVLVEAQAAGLPCVASDRITREVELTGKITYLPVETIENLQTAEKLAGRWARQIQALSRDKESEIWRPEDGILVKEAGFDIEDSAKKLERFYRALTGKGKKRKKNGGKRSGGL